MFSDSVQTLHGHRESDIDSFTPPSMAGLLLAARAVSARLGLAHPTVAEILDTTRASPSTAYSRRAALQAMLATLDRPPGRPRATSPTTDINDITSAMIRFLMDHPGAVYGNLKRRRYSGSFRRFVLDLRLRYPQIPAEAFAHALHIPASTLRAWQQQGDADAAEPDAGGRTMDPQPMRTGPLAMVLAAWLDWHGPFSRFCEHVQTELGIPWKPTFLSSLLASHGLRLPRARALPRPFAQASRGAFQTFFPGAQWVGDATSLTLHINEQHFRFTLELMVDAASGAIVGACLRDREDSQGVTAAFRDGVATTGTIPDAVLLDNHPCNRAGELNELHDATSMIYAARGRPQSKAHVEGAFGLFAQTAPELHLRADSVRALAGEILALIVQCWARTLNHRPRRSRGGLSRVDLYRDRQSTPAQRRMARAALKKRMATRARCGRRRNGASALRPFIVAELARLGIADPDGYHASALERYPVNVVLSGLGAYAGKRTHGTLPANADARYLLGIVRHIAEHGEGLHIADALWNIRGAAREHVFQALRTRQDAIVEQAATAVEQLEGFVDAALGAQSTTEQRYWLMAAADAIRGCDRKAQYRRAVRRIHASLEVPYSQRLAFVYLLAAELIPVGARASGV